MFFILLVEVCLVYYVLEINKRGENQILEKNCQFRKKLYKPWDGDIENYSKIYTFFLWMAMFV